MSARKQHKTNFCNRCLIALGCALLLFSIAHVYRDSFSSVDAAIVSSPNTAASTSPSPVQKRSTDVKRPNPLRRFFSRVAKGVTRVFRKPEPIPCRLPPMVSIRSSSSSITFCPTTPTPSNPVCSPNRDVSLSASVGGADTELLFTWNVTGGRLKGEGSNVTWDLSEVPEGTYTATVEVNDGNQLTANASTTVRIELCPGCERPPPRCPEITVSCPIGVRPNQPITFQANVSAGDSEMKPTYTWSVTAGRIISGQGTSKITLDISGLGRKSITATVSIGGVDPSCTGNTASCTIVDY